MAPGGPLGVHVARLAIQEYDIGSHYVQRIALYLTV